MRLNVRQDDLPFIRGDHPVSRRSRHSLRGADRDVLDVLILDPLLPVFDGLLGQVVDQGVHHRCSPLHPVVAHLPELTQDFLADLADGFRDVRVLVRICQVSLHLPELLDDVLLGQVSEALTGVQTGCDDVVGALCYGPFVQPEFRQFLRSQVDDLSELVGGHILDVHLSLGLRLFLKGPHLELLVLSQRLGEGS